MDSEERPAKLRKIDHTPEEPITVGDAPGVADPGTVDEPEAPKLSKNKLKRLRKDQLWEEGRDARKAKRKEKIQARKQRKREAKTTVDGDGQAHDGADGSTARARSTPFKAQAGKKVPITVVFDCSFEDLMLDTELKSLGTQITRCYSDNKNAPFRTHLVVSSFGGKLQERFDGILAKQYQSWKDFQVFPEDFVAVAEKAKEWMRGPHGGEVAGALANDKEAGTDAEDDGEGEVVYLSSESENTLERLKPNSTYIIGGLVDKNREKGICHRRATNRGIKTARLPIGEYMHLKSRQVLVTNHVLEIMLHWLETGDWGEAFMKIIPQRKGGTLKEKRQDQAGDAPEGTGDVLEEDDPKDVDDAEPDASTIDGSNVGATASGSPDAAVLGEHEPETVDG